MTARDWKPGDVASIEVPAKLAPGDGGGGWVRIVATRSGGLWVDVRDYNYGFVDTPQSREWREARPLVVIDPEDREQVQRFLDHEAEMFDDPEWMALDRLSRVQAAFRSMVETPKPFEPTGLGAVVEDANGHIHTRARNDCQPWVGLDGIWRPWARIAAVRLLAKGVPQ